MTSKEAGSGWVPADGFRRKKEGLAGSGARFLGFGLIFVLFLAVGGVEAGTTGTQVISLNAGWNAIFLEVEPAVSSPDAIMAGQPVDIVASFFDPGAGPQFVSNPAANLFRAAGWGTWYAGSRPDAFLKNLHAVYGQRGYLIHATNACVLSVTGAVTAARVTWTPDAYNFVGFTVSRSAPPTFDQFFAGSPALRHNRIYRMVNGTWRQVTDPTAETLRSGEAFWIYCSGATTYQGPLRAVTTLSQGLVLSSGRDSLILRNETAHPVTPTLTHMASGSNAVPLLIVVQTVNGTASAIQSMGVAKPAGDWSQDLPPLEAGASMQIPLEAQVENMTQPVHQSLLKVSTDMGTEAWIPVIAVRADGGAQ